MRWLDFAWRLAATGARLMVQALLSLQRGVPLAATPQPTDGVTYAAKIAKAEAAIDWSQPALAIERRLRAFDPFPGCGFSLGGETVKLWRARCVPGQGRPGQVLDAGAPDRLQVACGDGALDLQQLQRTGGRRISAAEFLHGHPVPAGTLLSPPR